MEVYWAPTAAGVQGQSCLCANFLYTCTARCMEESVLRLKEVSSFQNSEAVFLMLTPR